MPIDNDDKVHEEMYKNHKIEVLKSKTGWPNNKHYTFLVDGEPRIFESIEESVDLAKYEIDND